MLTDFFNERLSGPEKVKRLSEDHGIPMTREIGKEVPEVCTYAEALVLRGIKQGIDQEIINTEKEKNRADAETQRANAETQRANAESQRADAAEARIRELEAQLAETRKNEENI